MDKAPKYPVGIQSFVEMVTEGYAYVDKTAEVYELVNNAKYVFLSRPRRFGKSLLLSTIKEYLSGNRRLFADLEISVLNHGEWPEHPVLSFDMNPAVYDRGDSLDRTIGAQLSRYEAKYGVTNTDSGIVGRLYELILSAHKKTGRKVVVLVDEYDKPVLDVLDRPDIMALNRHKLRGFYGVLKSCDEHIRFAMLTGVGNMGNIDVFSGLNNMEDISMQPKYACLCGISEQEIRGSYRSGVEILAREEGISVEQAYKRLKEAYGGYCFARNLREVYCPFDLLLALKNSYIQDYWYSSGTPTYLVEMLVREKIPLTSINGIECDIAELANGDIASNHLVALLYYTGYLTISAYNAEFRSVYLSYPNKDVRTGFMKFLLQRFSGMSENNSNSMVRNLRRKLDAEDMDGFLRELQVLFCGVPYDLATRNEAHYQDVLYTVGMLLGVYVQAEVKTSQGRIDMLLGTRHRLYVMEFKLDGSARQAMRQIEENRYLLPYAHDGRTLVKVGVNFSSRTRNIDSWLIRES